MPDDILKAVPAVVDDPHAWYKPGSSMQEFHASDAPVRVLIGGRGCGKTTAVSLECISHGWHNAGAKIYILRKTQDSNDTTTLDTFEQTFRKCGTAYTETTTSLFKKIDGGKHFRIPSRLACEKFNEWMAGGKRSQRDIDTWLKGIGDVLCSHIHFAGVPSAQYRASRFRGYECSMLVFVEADQLEKEDLDLGLACLRWKGADPSTCNHNGFINDTCVILDTNPPGTMHWIAQMEEEAYKDRGIKPIFSNRTICERDGSRQYWHIATEENRDNLPPGYIESLQKQYRKNPAMYDRMLLGKFADAFDGQPVFHSFTQEHAYRELPWVKGAYLVRGWDFGTTHSVIWSAYWENDGAEYWWDLLEYYAEQSDTDRQCRAVLELTNKVFPFWNDRDICAGVKDYCDIAGTQKKAEGSSIKVLATHGFFPGYSRMGLQESIALVNRLFEKKDRHGNLIYRIDKMGCPRLYTALCGGYRYPNKGEPGYGSDEPLKGEAGNNYDHIADASRYPKINCMRLLRSPHEDPEAAVGRLSRPVKVNRKRIWW